MHGMLGRPLGAHAFNINDVRSSPAYSIEEAAAYQQLIEDFSLTHDDVASRVGEPLIDEFLKETGGASH